MPKTNPNRIKNRKERIKSKYKDGFLMREIAAQEGVSVEMISRYLGRPTKNKKEDES